MRRSVLLVVIGGSAPASPRLLRMEASQLSLQRLDASIHGVQGLLKSPSGFSPCPFQGRLAHLDPPVPDLLAFTADDPPGLGGAVSHLLAGLADRLPHLLEGALDGAVVGGRELEGGAEKQDGSDPREPPAGSADSGSKDSHRLVSGIESDRRPRSAGSKTIDAAAAFYQKGA